MNIRIIFFVMFVFTPSFPMISFYLLFAASLAAMRFEDMYCSRMNIMLVCHACNT